MIKKMLKDFLKKIKKMIKDQNNDLEEAEKAEKAEDEVVVVVEKEEEEEERDNVEEEEEEDRDWSHIPGPFLWGVMDYLTPFDALRIPYVCNSWRSTMKLEPNKVTIPWVLCNPSSSISNDRIFKDLSTNTITTVNIPYLLSESICISSKNGWLLMRSNLPVPIESSQGFYLKWKLRLFHPVSGTVIDLPEIPQGNCLGPAIIGPIWELTGKPKLIIQASYGEYKVVLRIIRPGQSKWEVHRYEHCGFGESTVARVVMHGSTRVCCFDPRGRMCVFDMVDESWLTFPLLCNSRPGFVVQCEDEIVKVSPLAPSLHGNQERVMFYKLELDENGVLGWVEMEKVGLENRWWFLDGNGESLCVRGVGRKVFQLSGHYGMVSNDGGGVSFRGFREHENEVRKPLSVVDLGDGIEEELMPDLAIHDYELGWIHMGSPVSV